MNLVPMVLFRVLNAAMIRAPRRTRGGGRIVNDCSSITLLRWLAVHAPESHLVSSIMPGVLIVDDEFVQRVANPYQSPTFDID